MLFGLQFCVFVVFFFFSSRRRHTRSLRDWSSDVCSSDLIHAAPMRGIWSAPCTRERAECSERADMDVHPLIDHRPDPDHPGRSEEHTSELQSRRDLVCRLLLEKKKKKNKDNREYTKKK